MRALGTSYCLFLNEKKELRFEEKVPRCLQVREACAAAARGDGRPVPSPGERWRRRSCENQFPVVTPSCRVSRVCSVPAAVPGAERGACIGNGLQSIATGKVWD